MQVGAGRLNLAARRWIKQRQQLPGHDLTFDRCPGVAGNDLG